MSSKPFHTWPTAPVVTILFALMTFGAAPVPAHDDDDDHDGRHRHRGPPACSQTASLQFEACRHGAHDDFFSASAICLQTPARAERGACLRAARRARSEGKALCRDQRVARRSLCTALGEGRYVPDFDAALFEDDFRDPANPNRYYPLRIGHVWEYQAADESNRIEVLDRTKLIDGVTCVVVNDAVTTEEGGGEDTDDCYAQRKDGTVDYCGESVRDFEVFAGDRPQEPELTSIDGSFKAGRDGDLSGTIFAASPTVGLTYRQEWSAGNAEDAATVVSTSYGYGRDPEFDEFVPRRLAELLCRRHDCVVVLEVTPIEPDIRDLKYYAAGVGLFLEVKPDSGETNELVGCNFDRRCARLPSP